MIYFPLEFLKFLIVGALVLTALAAVALLAMVVMDYVRGRVW